MLRTVIAASTLLLSTSAFAERLECLDGSDPVYTNVVIDVVDFMNPADTFEAKAVLTQPVRLRYGPNGARCYVMRRNAPSVVLLHGSAGMNSRGTFHAEALTRRYATLSIEMFARGASGNLNRPALPIFSYSHAFAGLDYLAEVEGRIDENGRVVADDGTVDHLPRKMATDPESVGCMGFSWGGVACMQAATQVYSQVFGTGLYGTSNRFAAHIAHDPSCYARNVPDPANPSEIIAGTLFGSAFGAPLTGAPLLIQVGSEDAYDNAEGESGSVPCLALARFLSPDELPLLNVEVLEGGAHAWDRVFTAPDVGKDVFARLGQPFLTGSPPADVPFVPDLSLALESRNNVRRFFREHLIWN